MFESPSSNLQGPPDEQAPDALEPIRTQPVSRRFLLFKGGLVAAFGVLAARLWQMQIAEGDRYHVLAEKNRIAAQPVKAPRGVIYDRNGIVLAGNKATWNIIIVPANLPTEDGARKAIYAELDRLLSPAWVLSLQTRRLPANAQDEVYDRLSQLVDRPAERLREEVRLAIQRDQLPILADDIPRDQVARFQQELANVPGPVLNSQHEFRVAQHALDPRLPVVIHHGVPRDQALLIESRRLLMPGVSIQTEPGRSYPSGTLASQILGYVGRVDAETRATVLRGDGEPVYDLDDMLGQSGMEAHLEALLRGAKGFHIVEVDTNRHVVREMQRTEPVPGSSVALTIDLGLQKEATEALHEQLARANVSTGAAVALDPATGEVLALVSLPTFNSQEFADGITGRAYRALLNDTNKPLFNRCVSGLYSPGACLLPFVSVEALRQQVITGTTTHNCRGGIHIPAEFNEISRQLYRCWRPAGHGILNVSDALAQSCDVFFYNLAVPPQTDARGKPYRYYDEAVGGTAIEFKGLGIERVNGVAAMFGFGRKTGLELIGEETGLLPTPEWKRQQGGRGDWTLGDTINSSVGQGDVLVTPMQMAVATAALANGGTVYRPRLLKSILRDGNRDIEEQQPSIVGRIEASREILDLVRQGMRQAVTNGTASRLTIPGVVVAGKTGTADTETPDAQGQTRQRPHAWFTAFAPYDNPRIAVTVILERAGEGAAYALPVAERILRHFFRPR